MKRRAKLFISSWRTTALISIFGLAYLFLISNLYNIQFNKNSFYEALAENQQRAAGVLDPLRGSIYFTDKNNNQVPAVINKQYSLIYAVPKEISDSAVAAPRLSGILNLDAASLEKKLSKPNDLFEELLFKASDEQVDEINNSGIKGLYIKNEVGRYYPFGTLASQLLGFTNSNGNGGDDTVLVNGQYGVEKYFNEELGGVPGKLQGDKVVATQDGENVNLTIDYNIQAQSEDILKNLVSEKGAAGGSIIVEDPKTGKILTMASYPDFDPNDYSQYEIKNFLNPTVQAVYEPGSVFKILTMAAGIDSGKITPDTTYVDKGYDIINGRKIMNWDHRAYGKITMTNVIEHSLNLGSTFAEQTMGRDIFKSYLYKFGLADLTGIELPGELKGNLSQLDHGRDINYATASYGQGVSVTPIEMINAASAIANGGNLMKPNILSDEQPTVIRRVISEDTAKKVTQMMVSAVKVNVLADIPNYRVAGKTGTAFVPDFKNGGYSDQVINTYIGWAPAFDPKFVLLVRLDKPKDAPLAGTTVVPAFRQLAEYILNYYNIPPDKIGNNE